MASKTPVTDGQRIRLVRAYLRELSRICKQDYGGDWDRMPKQSAGLPVDWSRVIARSGIQTTPAGASKLVESTVANDTLMDRV